MFLCSGAKNKKDKSLEYSIADGIHIDEYVPILCNLHLLNIAI